MHQEQKVTMDVGSRLKRKFDTFNSESDKGDPNTVLATDLVDKIVPRLIEILNTSSSYLEADCAITKKAAHLLSELVKDEKNIDTIVEYGAVPALVKHLQTNSPLAKDDSIPGTYKCEIQKECLVALWFIALKDEYKQIIVDTGVISQLVNILKRREVSSEHEVVYGAANLIRELGYENVSIKSRVRIEGGIPPLIELLESANPKLQKMAALALGFLVLGNDENKNQIVELDALSSIILLLQSDKTFIQEAGIFLIVALVSSSPNLEKQALQAGALQPVICLLSSSCIEIQRQAAGLIYMFAASDSDNKTHIAKRGAIPPLIKMLHSPDDSPKEQAAMTLGYLAYEDPDNQAGIGCYGGIEPLLNLLGTKTENLQYYSAFALNALSDNEDNVVYFVKAGGVQKLQGQFVQRTECHVAETLKKLKEKIHGQVLKQLLSVMRTAEEYVQKRVALALADLCDLNDVKLVFLDNNGVELLLELLDSTDLEQQQSGLNALYKLTNEFNSVDFVDTTLPAQHVNLGQKFLNDTVLSDVTFIIEDKPLYAHKIFLVASSDAFRAMFYSGYKERDTQDIVITNIKRNIFELMIRFIYTGYVDVETDVAQDLLRAADQYLLEGLKRHCELKIAQDISAENIQLVYELADASNASMLTRSSISFVLNHFDQLSTKPWFSKFVKDIIPGVRSYVTNFLESSSSE